MMMDHQDQKPPSVSLTAWSISLCLGIFLLLNLLGQAVVGRFDATIWLADLRPLPHWARVAMEAMAGTAMLAFALRPAMGRARTAITAFALTCLLVALVCNSVTFYVLLARGAFHTSMPVPLSLVWAAAIAMVIYDIARLRRRARGARPTRPRPLACVLSTCVMIVLFPLAQMLSFGLADYARPADAAVVFGARTHADGKPSQALADRVRTACDLYNHGLVRKLIFSGGPGDGPVSETQAMTTMAIAAGVSPGDILTDGDGLNTELTASHTAAMLRDLHAHTILAVSHWYHLPRVKLAYQRQGIDVCTVPAVEPIRLSYLPIYVAREIPAFWAYYFRLR
jgi:vancomycin permeability regulator SanA